MDRFRVDLENPERLCYRILGKRTITAQLQPRPLRQTIPCKGRPHAAGYTNHARSVIDFL